MARIPFQGHLPLATETIIAVGSYYAVLFRLSTGKLHYPILGIPAGYFRTPIV